MRILITGSRDWTDENQIKTAIYEAAGNYVSSPSYFDCPCGHKLVITIVHGSCPTGADNIADKLFRNNSNAIIERHPAEWQKYGKSAGFRRNAEMVNLGADVCLAFIKNNSRGASHTADLAEKAGIPTKIFRE